MGMLVTTGIWDHSMLPADYGKTRPSGIPSQLGVWQSSRAGGYLYYIKVHPCKSDWGLDTLFSESAIS